MSNKTHGVPRYANDRAATVIEVRADGRFLVELDPEEFLVKIPAAERRRIVRRDEISRNYGYPKEWPEDE